MATKKKTAGKAKTVTKTTAPKATAARPVVALKAVTKPRTKSEILNALAGATGLSRKDVSNVFSAINEAIHLDVGKKGPGVFTFPGLMKVQRRKKEGTKAGMWKNPFTGKEEMRKAKPARNIVKIRALKALKASV